MGQCQNHGILELEETWESLTQTLHWTNEEQAQQGKESLRTAARLGTQPGPTLGSPNSHGLLALVGHSVCGEKRLLLTGEVCWGGGRPQSCPGRKGEVGQGKQDSEGGGSPPRCRAVTSSGTRSCSNHMLRAGLAALNDDPRKGLSSCRGFDTSLPGGLCWAVMSSPEQFRTGRGEIQWKRLGPLLS